MTKNDEKRLLGTNPYSGGSEDFYGYDNALLAAQDYFLSLRAEGISTQPALQHTIQFIAAEGWGQPRVDRILAAELEAPFGWSREDGQAVTAEQLSAALALRDRLDDEELSVELPDSIPGVPDSF